MLRVVSNLTHFNRSRPLVAIDPLRFMSQKHITAKLPSPVRDLVVSLTQDGRQHMGRNDNDEGEVAQWIEKIAEGALVKGDLQVLQSCYLITIRVT